MHFHIRAAFSDGIDFNATLIGADPSTDIAVIKVYDGDLKPLQFANSDLIEPGQIAIAIGNPLGIAAHCNCRSCECYRTFAESHQRQTYR